MDFSQFKDKNWWIDVVFYCALSLVIATVFCWIIFLLKNGIQKEEIQSYNTKLEDIGSEQQKEYEKTVLNYQQKIKDFSVLFENHEFASHVFGFMQDQTMPRIWFSRFDLDKKNSRVQLTGESESVEDFSRQINKLETNENVKIVEALNSTLANSEKVQFNINLALNQKLFSYDNDFYVPPEGEIPEIEFAVSGSSESPFQTRPEDNVKLITVFDLLLSPEVIGRVDQQNLSIKLDVPYGTDIKNLIPLIIISPGASIVPGSAVVQDFTSPVVYRVTAQDKSWQDYTVSVNILPESSTGEKSGSWAVFLVFLLAGFMIAAFVFIYFIFRKMSGKKSLNNYEV